MTACIDYLIIKFLNRNVEELALYSVVLTKFLLMQVAVLVIDLLLTVRVEETSHFKVLELLPYSLVSWL